MSDLTLVQKATEKVTKQPISNRELKNLGHFVDTTTLGHTALRSGRQIPIKQKHFKTPKNKSFTVTNPKEIQPDQTKFISRLPPNSTLIRRSISFETLDTEENNFRPLNLILPQFHFPIMAQFTFQDFRIAIPEYSNDPSFLPVFLKRCDTYYASLDAPGKVTFISNLIYRLSGKAFLIFQGKKYNTWEEFKTDLIEQIKISKSIAALQNEMTHIKQNPGQSARKFADVIKLKLKELNDKIQLQYQHAEVIKSFSEEFEKSAIRTFREGITTPLKYRIINFEAATLDDIVKKASEEEPFVTADTTNYRNALIQRSQSNTNQLDNRPFQNSSYAHNRFSRYSNSRWNAVRDSNNNISYSRQNNYVSSQPRYTNDQNYSNRLVGNRNNQSFGTNTNNDRGKDQILSCTRCHKTGHTVNTCYVRLNDQQANENKNQNDNTLLEQVKQISFLEVPRRYQRPPNPNRPMGTNPFRK